MPSLPGLTLTRNPRLTEPMLRALERPVPGDPVSELLRERGYLVKVAEKPEKERRQGNWLAAPSRLPWLEKLAPGGVVLERFQVSRWRRATGLLGLVSEGESAWFYRTGCADCFLARWLQGLDDGGAGLTWLVARDRPLAFRPLPDELLREAAVRACRSPGRAVFVSQEGFEELDFMPVPACLRCVPQLSPRRVWQGHRLAIVRKVSFSAGFMAARLYPGAWATGLRPYASGAGRTRHAALAEALERYSASVLPPDVDEVQPLVHPLWRGVPGKALALPVEGPEGRVLAPLERVLLSPQFPGLSHGLAAATTLERARRRGMLELLERDALARFWLSRKGFAWADDVLILPGPVVTALAIYRGVGVTTGSACGPRAVERARTEARQNAAYLADTHPFSDVPTTYEEHLRYYWHHPERLVLPRLPRLRRLPRPTPIEVPMYWRELTPPDVRALGLRVVRVIAPSLLYPPPDHRDWGAKVPHPFG